MIATYGRVVHCVFVAFLYFQLAPSLFSKRHLSEADALLSKKRKVEDHSGSSSSRKSSRKSGRK